MVQMVGADVGFKKVQILVYATNVKRGGLMIWAEIIENQVVGPFLVPEYLKINSANYSSFLKENLLPWLNSLSDDIRKTMPQVMRIALLNVC